MSAPSMKERKACWDARDEYWKCLDENLEDTTKCEIFKGTFEKTCPQQWVKYFNRRRDYLKYKALLETKGFEPLAPNKS
nr:cytochrome c oxidase assembly factor 6 homolog [Pogona vitticeps]XP_020642582.1 cytochrome c oxidase assembly factor 6 homolog [Pogona vitticeps]XP_020642591.1 cytochrome c oxidase assembly factor 6 homolog [Pogona vitticeps]